MDPAEFTDGPELTVEDASVVEGDAGTTAMTFTARLAQAPGHPVTAEWNTQDDTASSPADFAASSGLVTFSADETTKLITVPVKGDTDAEPAESFLLRLRGARGAGLGVARATGLIIADDLGITDSTPDRAGTGTVTLTVRGGGFLTGTAVALRRVGRADIPGNVLFTDPGHSRMEARFDLSEAALGPYDLVVTGPGGTSATRLGALTVEALRRPRVEVSVSAPAILRFGFTGRGTVSLHNRGNVDADLELVTLSAGNLKLNLPGRLGFEDPPVAIAEDELAGLLGGTPTLPGGATRSFTVRFQSTSDVAHAPLTIEAEAIDRDFLDSAVHGPAPDPVAGHITGRLVTPAGDEVAGVQVGAAPAPGQRGRSASDVTAGDGSFDLRPLGDGEYRVAAGGDPGLSPDPVAVTIDAANPAPDVTLTKAVSPVTGSVRRADGTRVGDARVALIAGNDTIATTRADAAGGFAFAIVASGTYRLRAVSAGAGIAEREVTVDAGTAVTGLELTTGARALTVTVSDGSGPVEGALVTAREGNRRTGPERTTNADGHAVFAGLPASELTIQAAAAGHGPAGATAAPGTGTAAIALPAAARIEGELATTAGDPLPGAAVIAVERASGRERRGVSAADGHYAVTALGPGTYDVWFASAGLEPELAEGVSVADGAAVTLDRTLDEGGTVREVVLETPGGAPAAGARFSVRHVPTGALLQTTLSGRDGIATVGPLPSGDFEVVADLPGGAAVTHPLTVGRGSGRRAPTHIGRLLQLQVPRPGVKANARELYYLQNPPEESWFDGTREPVPHPYDLSSGYLEYLHIDYAPPCSTATRLVRLLDVKRHVLNELFTRYHQAWKDMDSQNNADMAGYLTTSAKLAGDILTLGRLSQAEGALERLGDFDGALQAQILGLAQTVAASVDSGQLPSATDIGEQLQGALETARQRQDPTDLRQFGDFSEGVANLNLLRDIIKLKLEADKFPDQVRERGDAFRDAEAQYLNAITAIKQMTVELQRLADEGCPDDPAHPRPPRQPGPGPSGGWRGDLRLSGDPNDILGPAGVGAERWIPADQALAYTVRFENQPTATAPAVLVAVTTQLDADLDLDTFALGELGWGAITVPVPPGRQSYHADVPQEGGDVVRVDAELDRASRTVRWELAAIDPETGELEEAADAGFLEPEDGTHRGQGFVTYDARAAGDLEHGDEIGAQARIVFDRNAPIDTPEHLNTVDRLAPESSVTAADAAGCAGVALTWSGSDEGAGVSSYDVWVSEDDTPFVPWLTGTDATSATYPGVAGHRYAFSTAARDRVGQVEALPVQGDAGRTVACDRAAPTTLGSVSGAVPSGGFFPGPVTVRLDGVDAPGGSGVNQVRWTAAGASPGLAAVDGDAAVVPVPEDGTTTVEAVSRDAAGNESAPRRVTVRIDSRPPDVSIATPAEGAQVVVGSGATADFGCSDSGAGIDVCSGTVASGARIDAGPPGPRTLSVAAVDRAGRRTDVTRSYAVIAAPSGPGPAALPRLSAKPIMATLGKLDRRGRAKLILRNREAFAVTGTIRALAAKGHKTLAKGGRFTLAAQGRRTRRLRFARSVRRAVKRSHRVKLRLRAVVKGPAGDTRTVTLKASLRGPRRKRH